MKLVIPPKAKGEPYTFRTNAPLQLVMKCKKCKNLLSLGVGHMYLDLSDEQVFNVWCPKCNTEWAQYVRFSLRVTNKGPEV